MKKKWIAAAAAAVLLAGAAGWLLYDRSQVHIGAASYPKNAQTLDVRADHLSPEEYDALCAQLPDCQVLWELPFQDGWYPLDTRAITLKDLTELELLERLPLLEQVDASGCADWQGAFALAQERTDWQVRYCIPVCGIRVENTETRLTLRDASAPELLEKLACLPQITAIELEGALPSGAELEQLEKTGIALHWTVPLGGQVYDCTETELTLAGEVSAAALNDALEHLPRVTRVDLLEAGMPQQEKQALSTDWPGIFFLWEGDFFGQQLRTDVTEIDISGTPVADPAEVEAILPCFPQLAKFVMCDSGLDNETMDALNRAHPEVQIVWSVRIDWKMIRTDIPWFMPFRQDVTVNTENIYNLRYCTEVTCVDIGHADVENCEWAAFMPHLKYFLIGDTPIKDISPLADHKELIYVEIFKTGVADYSPLLSCTALEDLNLGYTYGDAEIIAQMTWLKNLWWHRPTPPWGGPETETRLNLGKILPNAHVDVSYTASSTDRGWRELPNYYAQRDLMGMFYMEG